MKLPGWKLLAQLVPQVGKPAADFPHRKFKRKRDDGCGNGRIAGAPADEALHRLFVGNA
jgi:hypothetical protein